MFKSHWRKKQENRNRRNFPHLQVAAVTNWSPRGACNILKLWATALDCKPTAGLQTIEVEPVITLRQIREDLIIFVLWFRLTRCCNQAPISETSLFRIVDSTQLAVFWLYTGWWAPMSSCSWIALLQKQHHCLWFFYQISDVLARLAGHISHVAVWILQTDCT